MASRADQRTGPKRDPRGGRAPAAGESAQPGAMPVAADALLKQPPAAATAVPPNDAISSNTLTRDIVSAATLDVGQRVEVPVVEEQLSVEKRTIEKGRVVVHVQPTVERQQLEVELFEESVEVERVPVNRFVESPVSVRQEGDVTIVPVFEEVLVVEKRLMLKEEIRLVRRKLATREQREFDVRKEEVHVLRTDGPDAPAPGAGTPVAKTGESADGRRRNAARGKVP